MSRKVLVVDDDLASGRLVRAVLAAEGYEVVVATDGEQGLARARSERPDVIALDLHLPGMNGLDVLERLREVAADVPVIMLTADGDPRPAVRATQLGAFDYMTKPFDQDELVLVIHRALETRALRREVASLRRRVDDGGGLVEALGPSPLARQVIEQVKRVAATAFTVLITGEPGTGKELVAQAIHRQSERAGRAFIAVACGAVPEALLESELFGHEQGAQTGRFQLAEGGTFFLDEVGNLPPGLQAKLLRVLESRQVQAVGAGAATPMDVRFVAATSDDLQTRVTDGRFRADLYFRLAQYTIALPPLRDRRPDVAYLAQRFLEEVRVELRRPVQQIAPEAQELLERCPWPGNVRQLRNVVRQAVLLTDGTVVEPEVVRGLLGANARAGVPVLGGSLKEIADRAARDAERQVISEILRETRGNKAQAARALRTDYKTLHTKMKQLGIRARDFDG